MRKLAQLPTTGLLATFVLFISLLSACSQEGKVGEAASLYGTTSKKWVLDKETAAGGDKVDQADDDQSFTFYQNGTYNMATSAMTQTGKYTFDQAGKKIIMSSGDTGMESTFTVTTLTDDHLTLTAPDGSAIKLKSE
ncbi:MAG: hypothetical protein H7330_05180 [Hymenobacteraceae bacterium]|nr:hypothetical protein [Hymenobacteraceae bacterium]